jgi:hypothetical protein
VISKTSTLGGGSVGDGERLLLEDKDDTEKGESVSSKVASFKVGLDGPVPGDGGSDGDGVLAGSTGYS